MRERPYLLGPQESLLAITTEPAEAPGVDRPVMIVLNAGIVHRVGPHRNSVGLCRALAGVGFRALRLDLSGIGDSAARRDALGFEAGARADIRELLDDLGSRFGAKRFVLMGLCSGADNAFYAALDDDRVVGAALLDGIAYRTPRYYVEKYRDKVTRPSAWINLGRRASRIARARLEGVLGRDHASDTTEPEAPPAPPAVPDYVRDFEPRDVVAKKFQTLCDRGVQTFWIYTSGTNLYYNYDRQFFDMFKDVDFKGTVEHAYFGDSNHTFTEVANQRQLTDALATWASKTFG